MSAALAFCALTLRLNLRNPMAMIYGYAFPLVFLVAFAILYRHDPAPLIGHLGELLTVTALGGACFGLPTTIVAERERGVWRRYRATPAGAPPFVIGLILSRLALLYSAALIQLALALALLGMPIPADPLGLVVAFLAVSLALIGLGLIVAMLAGSVPAVQALGQCIFLPMLMIGGVAVRLSSLPDWTQALSAFFPGRYAVSAIQASATGMGLGFARFDLLALAGFALASGLVAAALFRWDRDRPCADKRLLAAGLLLWIGIGMAGLATGIRHAEAIADTAPVAAPEDFLKPAPTPVAAASPKPLSPAPTSAPKAGHPSPRSWRDVTQSDLDSIAFERLPDDEGLVSPIAPRGTLEDAPTQQAIAAVRAALPGWPPAQVADPVARVRNLLVVLAVPDLLQIDPLERHLPWLVFDRMRQQYPPDNLARLLFWVSQYPAAGDGSALSQIDALGLPAVTGPTDRVDARVTIYALKLLARLEAVRPHDEDRP
jgi:ABC-2 type transport system permease protein